MSSWLLAVAATLLSYTATALGALAATRLSRAGLPLLLALVLALDVACGALNVLHPGIRNGLVVLTAIPLGASIASLVESRSAFAAVLLTAAAVEVMTSFGGSVLARAAASGADETVRFLVILVPSPSRPIGIVTLVDLAATGMAVACAGALAVRRTRAFLAGALALVAVVTLDRSLDRSLAHLPVLAALLLLVLLDRHDRRATPESSAETEP
jgi:hypothetical protein